MSCLLVSAFQTRSIILPAGSVPNFTILWNYWYHTVDLPDDIMSPIYLRVHSLENGGRGTTKFRRLWSYGVNGSFIRLVLHKETDIAENGKKPSRKRAQNKSYDAADAGMRLGCI